MRDFSRLLYARTCKLGESGINMCSLYIRRVRTCQMVHKPNLNILYHFQHLRLPMSKLSPQSPNPGSADVKARKNRRASVNRCSSSTGQLQGTPRNASMQHPGLWSDTTGQSLRVARIAILDLGLRGITFGSRG